MNWKEVLIEYKWVLPISLFIIGWCGLFWIMPLSNININIDMSMDNNTRIAAQCMNDTINAQYEQELKEEQEKPIYMINYSCNESYSIKSIGELNES